MARFATGLVDVETEVLVVDAGTTRDPFVIPPSYPGLVAVVGPETGRAAPGVASSADLALTSETDPPAPWVHAGDIESALGALNETLRSSRSAGAAMTLVQVLRTGSDLPVVSALILESFAYSMLLAGPAFAAWRAGTPARPPEPGRGDEVLTERQGDLLRVVLNRPARHNAYNRHLRDQLHTALAVAAADPAIRVELSGAGPSFCSGGDLDEFATAPDPVTAHSVRVGRSPARQLDALAGRVTARLHGACAGSGLELPAFAGRVLARPGARFWLPELAMGLIPGAGGTVSLPRRIGRQRTVWLGLTGTPIGVDVALSWGLIDGVDE
jgi:hypothetical protein